MDSFAMSKQDILEYLENASVEQITEILFATMRRQEESFPDYEMIVFSLPRYHRKKREKCLEELKRFQMKYYCGDGRQT